MKTRILCAQKLRVKPIAAGLALVLAASVAGFPVDSLAAGVTPASKSWHGWLAAHPDVKARVDNARQHSRAKRQQRAQLLRSGYTASSNAVAAVLPVSNCNDNGAGSLRDVIAGAATGDTIDLTALTCSTITLTSGTVSIPQDDLTITGPGAANLTLHGNDTDTVLFATGAGTLTVSDVTISHGYYYAAIGAGVWSANGNVVLNNTVLSDNATGGGRYYPAGGAAVATGYGDITLSNSTVSNNSSQGYVAYGAVAAMAGNVTVVGSTISGNQSNPAGTGYFGVGGGIYSNGTTTTVDSTIAQNSATGTYGSWGGGINAIGSASISGSAVSGNSVGSNGGGVYTQNLMLINSTVSGNQSNAYGAGVGNYGGTAAIYNATLSANTAGVDGGGIDSSGGSAFTVVSSILFGNTAPTDADVFLYFAGGSGSMTGSNNVIGSTSAVTPAGTLTTDPLLGPLQNNGGPTATHAPGAGSPAIDAGANPLALGTDQRGTGFPRVAAAAADIGAVEVQPAVVLAPAIPVPASANWALALLGALMGFAGWLGFRRRPTAG
ncbi:MAG TPA: IPTL-CTERM sorting domain-containing protein [Rhodanobacteraceae bacterium]|nr:IPTL-CTERM sorting domain-containing protein [Rhodanobacteraceae bacterium]